MSPDEIIAKARAVLDAAPPGPWTADSGDSWCECGAEPAHESADGCPDWCTATPASVPEIFTVDCGDFHGLSYEAARAIKVMRNVFPALLDLLRDDAIGCDCPGDPHEAYCARSIALVTIEKELSR